MKHKGQRTKSAKQGLQSGPVDDFEKCEGGLKMWIYSCILTTKNKSVFIMTG